jgi:predicted alpha/beta hydrolase family esterase
LFIEELVSDQTPRIFILSAEDEFLVTDAAVSISVDMWREKASVAHVGHYMREYGVDVWPEYLKKEVIWEVDRMDARRAAKSAADRSKGAQ